MAGRVDSLVKWLVGNGAKCACITVSLVTISCAQFCQRTGLADFVAYLGYGILMLTMAASLVNGLRAGKGSADIAWFVACLFLLSIGIMLQDMSVTLKVRLFLTQVVLAASMVFGKYIIKEIHHVRMIGYALLTGLLIVMISSLVLGADFYSNVDEGAKSVLLSGFNGGLLHKNYFAITLFVSIACLHLHWLVSGRKIIDIFAILFELILLLFSHARSSWILLAIYGIVVSVYWTLERKKGVGFDRFALVLAIVVALGTLSYAVLYRFFFAESMTYMARINGLMNWIEYTLDNPIQFITGNAGIFFGSTESYYDHFRTVTGDSGAVDMAILNILIKAGVLGVVAYIATLYRPIRYVVSKRDAQGLMVAIAIIAPFLASMLSENVAATISLPYLVSAYLVLGVCFHSGFTNDVQSKCK